MRVQALALDEQARRRLQAAWLCWIILATVVSIRATLQPQRNNCVPLYLDAGRSWVEGIDLYQRLADSCRYSPFVHVLLAPFSFLPDAIGSLLWRWLGIGLFLTGLACLVRTICPAHWGGKGRAAVLLLALPLSLGSFNNGQANVLMMGGILWGVAAAGQGWWWLSAAALALACLLKLYPLALAFLLMAAFPRAFAPRFLLLLAAGLLVPFLLQDPSYVSRQYSRWLSNLIHDDRTAWPIEHGYRDLWQMLRVWQAPVTLAAYRLIQLGIAGVIGLMVVWLSWRRLPARRLLCHALTLGCLWMTLCGPATESCTYILLGPALALCVVTAERGEMPRWLRVVVAAALLLLIGGTMVTIFPFHRAVQFYAPQSLGALLLLLASLVLTFRDGWAGRSVEFVGQAPVPAPDSTSTERAA